MPVLELGMKNELSETASADLRRNCLKYEKNEDMVNPHQLYGGKDKGEFSPLLSYDLSVLDR